MSKSHKLVDKLLSKPKDLAFEEAVTILEFFGYRMIKSGRTGGSRIRFVLDKAPRKKVFTMHKPHPQNILLPYQVKNIITELKQEGFI